MDVKKEREKSGLTQGELAQQTGIPRDRIAKWEQGKGKPKAEDTIKLQIAFGKKVQEIVPKTDTPLIPEDHSMLIPTLMKQLITLTETTNRLMERQEKNIIEKIDRIDSNLDSVVAASEKLTYDMISGRHVVLQSLARIEGKSLNELLDEADSIKIDEMKATDEHYKNERGKQRTPVKK